MKFFRRRKEKKEGGKGSSKSPAVPSPSSSPSASPKRQMNNAAMSPSKGGGHRPTNTSQSSPAESSPSSSPSRNHNSGYLTGSAVDVRGPAAGGVGRLLDPEPASPVSTPVRTNVAAMATAAAQSAALQQPPQQQPYSSQQQGVPGGISSNIQPGINNNNNAAAAAALQKQMEESNAAGIELTRNLVKKFIADIWNRGEVDLIPEVCSPSLRFNGNTGFDRVGHDGLARMVATIRDALDDYHCEIHSMVVEHNKAFCRLRFTGKHTGNLLGYPPTGKVVGWMGATEFTCQNGKILKVWELGDIKTLEEQLIAVDQPMEDDHEEDD